MCVYEWMNNHVEMVMVMVMALGCTLYVIQRDDADEVYQVIIYDIVLYFIIFKPAYYGMLTLR